MSMRRVEAAAAAALSWAAYIGGALGVAGVLLGIAKHYVPFDSASLVFVHERLPGAALDAKMFALAAAIWTLGFLGLVVSAYRSKAPAGKGFLLSLCGVQLVISALFAYIPIAVDSDQYAYAGYAYEQSQGNPYAPPRLPADAPRTQRDIDRHWGDPILANRYGPVWTALNYVVVRPYFGAPLPLQTGALRAAAIAAALALTWLLGLSMRGATPRAVPLAFALNPIVVLEVANGAHNDVYIALFGVAAAVLASRGRFGFAGIALGLATGVKFAYLPLVVPMAAYVFAVRRRTGDVLATVAGFAAIVTFSAAPFGLKGALIDAPRASLGSAGGPIALAARGLRHVPVIGHHAVAAIDVLLVCVIVCAVIVLSLDLLAGRFAPGFAVVLALAVLASAGKLEPWYALMATPLLLAGRTGTIAFAGISAGALVLVLSSFTGAFDTLTAIAAGVGASALLYVALQPPSPRKTAYA